MNAVEFLKSKLSEISDKIPNIGLKYAYDRITSFHIIEVYPEDIRCNNTSYMKLEHDLWINFQNSYPNEDLLISEVDDINDMSNLLFEKIPVDRIEINNFTGENLFTIKFYTIPQSEKKETVTSNHTTYESIYVDDTLNNAA